MNGVRLHGAPPPGRRPSRTASAAVASFRRLLAEVIRLRGPK